MKMETFVVDAHSLAWFMAQSPKLSKPAAEDDDIAFDYNEEGKIAGIEVLDASRRIVGIGKKNFSKKVNLRRR